MISLIEVKKIRHALNLICNTVKPTLGPTAKNVILAKNKDIQIIDDGALIIKDLDFSTNYENRILELIRQASLKTNQIVGDGTTTTILLASKFIQESIQLLFSGIHPIYLIVGLKKINYFILNKLKEYSIPLNTSIQLKNILTTSVGNLDSQLINEIQSAFLKKGKDGIIYIEEREFQSKSIEVEFIDGLQFDQGFSSPYFAQDLNKFEVILENSYLLITDKTIDSLDQIKNTLEFIKTNNASLVLIAAGYNKTVISTLVINYLNDNLKVIPVKAPFFGIHRNMILEDIAFVTNSKFISQKLYNDNYMFSVSDLGKVDKAIITNKKTNIFLLKSSKLALKRRLNELQQKLKNEDVLYEKDLLKQRIPFLAGGIIKLYLSAPTKSELQLLRYKIEDGIFSLNSSFQEGITISTNSLFVHFIELINNWSMLNLTYEELFAIKIFQKTLSYPFYQLCQNTNVNYSLTFDLLKKKGYPFGFDFSKKQFNNLLTLGILDSAKMIRVTLQNSLSVATSLILSF